MDAERRMYKAHTFIKEYFMIAPKLCKIFDIIPLSFWGQYDEMRSILIEKNAEKASYQ